MTIAYLGLEIAMSDALGMNVLVKEKSVNFTPKR
jgi:hypothetical protein